MPPWVGQPSTQPRLGSLVRDKFMQLFPNRIANPRSGTGYVTGFEDASDKLTFTIDSEATQLYDLTIRAAAIYGEKRTTVILNGGASSEVLFPAADDWADIAGGQLLLNAGDNTVDIVSNWGWYVQTSTASPRDSQLHPNITR